MYNLILQFLWKLSVIVKIQNRVYTSEDKGEAMVEETFPTSLKFRIDDMRSILNHRVNVGIDQETVKLSQKLDILIAEYMKIQLEQQKK